MELLFRRDRITESNYFGPLYDEPLSTVNGKTVVSSASHSRAAPGRDAHVSDREEQQEIPPEFASARQSQDGDNTFLGHPIGKSGTRLHEKTRRLGGVGGVSLYTPGPRQGKPLATDGKLCMDTYREGNYHSVIFQDRLSDSLVFRDPSSFSCPLIMDLGKSRSGPVDPGPPRDQETPIFRIGRHLALVALDFLMSAYQTSNPGIA